MVGDSDVFVSYAADTKPLAEELTRALEQQGIRAWADFKDLQPGQRWQDEVENALERARWILILVSPNSSATRWVEEEWRAALQKAWSDTGKMLIPLVVGGDDPPPFLRPWVALRVDPGDKPAQWTNEVVQTLRSGRNQAAHGLTDRDRETRSRRLDEMTRAAEEFRRREPGSGSAPANSKR